MDTPSVYDEVARPIVADVMNGIHGSIMAYGQTSSGKTHTMMGSPGHKGIITLAVEQIFDTMVELSDQLIFDFKVSCLEIYNETVADLLDPTRTNLKISTINDDQVRLMSGHLQFASYF